MGDNPLTSVPFCPIPAVGRLCPGRCLVSSEAKGHAIIRHLADYVLLWTTRYAGMYSDDLAKSPHMARALAGGPARWRHFGALGLAMPRVCSPTVGPMLCQMGVMDLNHVFKRSLVVPARFGSAPPLAGTTPLVLTRLFKRPGAPRFSPASGQINTQCLIHCCPFLRQGGVTGSGSTVPACRVDGPHLGVGVPGHQPGQVLH